MASTSPISFSSTIHESPSTTSFGSSSIGSALESIPEEDLKKTLEALIRREAWIEIVGLLQKNPILLNDINQNDFPFFLPLLQGIRLTKDKRVPEIYEDLLKSPHMKSLSSFELGTLVKEGSSSILNTTADKSDILDRALQLMKTDYFGRIKDWQKIAVIHDVFKRHKSACRHQAHTIYPTGINPPWRVIIISSD